MRALVSVLVFLALVLGAHASQAKFAVPPIQGHVTDAAHVLSPGDSAEIEARLTRYMAELGVEIAVFVPASLEGETVEDVAYDTFNTWRIGRAGLDNGVLLVIAPKEHRIRIETGKGVGGQLTDLQSSDIIEHRIAPKLRAADYRGAIEDGVDSIAADLGSSQTPAQAPEQQSTPPSVLVVIGILVVTLVLFRLMFGGWMFWGGGRGGGVGGGYFGGGGRSGGGGASGSW